MGLIRYDSRVDECCCRGFLSARNALKSGSVFAGWAEIWRFIHCVQGNTEKIQTTGSKREAIVPTENLHLKMKNCPLNSDRGPTKVSLRGSKYRIQLYFQMPLNCRITHTVSLKLMPQADTSWSLSSVNAGHVAQQRASYSTLAPQLSNEQLLSTTDGREQQTTVLLSEE